MFRRALRFHGSGKYVRYGVLHSLSRKRRPYNLSASTEKNTRIPSRASFARRIYATRRLHGVFGVDSQDVGLFSGIDRSNGFGLRQIEREKNCCIYFFDHSNAFCCIYLQYENVLRFDWWHYDRHETLVVLNRTRVHVIRITFLFCFSITFWKYIQTWTIILRTNNTTFVYDAYCLVKVLRRWLTK